jgi:hypothetical protein
MLKKRNEILPSDIGSFITKIGPCFQQRGLLARAPGSKDQEGPDDYHGVLAACAVLELPEFANNILSYGWSNWWVMNNEMPGTPYKSDGRTTNWSAYFIRFPQLIAMAYSASKRSPIWAFPFFWYAALIILYSGLRNFDKGNADARRLPWLLIQCMQGHWLCDLASRVWYWKLQKDYGENGMITVASIYYQKGHPFSSYWIT